MNDKIENSKIPNLKSKEELFNLLNELKNEINGNKLEIDENELEEKIKSLLFLEITLFIVFCFIYILFFSILEFIKLKLFIFSFEVNLFT